jgi:hypothetical protein
MRLRVNLITRGHFWPSGEDVPNHLVPDWCRIKHRCDDIEAQAIRQRRAELRAEAAERREKVEAQKAAKKAAGAKQSVS